MLENEDVVREFESFFEDVAALLLLPDEVLCATLVVVTLAEEFVQPQMETMRIALERQIAKNFFNILLIPPLWFY